MDLADAILAVQRVAADAHAARVAELRRAFEARTGAFGPDDPWFEARSGAFWDDAVTSAGLARELADELPAGARAWAEPMARAHRGLFRASPEGGAWLLRDVWSGVELLATTDAAGLRDALASAAGLVDGRVVGLAETGAVVLLPGALFHAEDATTAIEALLPAARASDMTTPAVLDALMRMDHAYRALSRVKAAFAYRKEALRG